MISLERRICLKYIKNGLLELVAPADPRRTILQLELKYVRFLNVFSILYSISYTGLHTYVQTDSFAYLLEQKWIFCSWMCLLSVDVRSYGIKVQVQQQKSISSPSFFFSRLAKLHGLILPKKEKSFCFEQTYVCTYSLVPTSFHRFLTRSRIFKFAYFFSSGDGIMHLTFLLIIAPYLLPHSLANKILQLVSFYLLLFHNYEIGIRSFQNICKNVTTTTTLTIL